MVKTSKIFGGLLAVGLLATMMVGGVTANASGPGNSNDNLSGNGTSVGSASTTFEAAGSDKAEAKSTAQFEVEGGKLVLVAVPDFDFGTVDGGIILSGGEKTLAGNSVQPGTSKNATAFDGNASGLLVVRDGRGPNGKWKLQLAMDPAFKAPSAPGVPANPALTISNVSLSLAAIAGTNSLSHSISILPSATTIQDTAKTIVNANPGGGQTEFALTATANAAKLTFPTTGNTDFVTGAKYQSNLTWTLEVAA